MNRSDIIVPIELQAQSIDSALNDGSEHVDPMVRHENVLSSKLRTAYIAEQHKLEIIEVELNRASIFVVDKNGNMRMVPLLSEH